MSFKSSLYILDDSHLWHMSFARHVCGLSLYSLDRVVCRAEVLNFSESNLLIIFSWIGSLVCLNSHWESYCHLDFFPMLSFRSFRVLHLTFRFDSIWDNYCEGCKISVCKCTYVPAPLGGKTVFAPLYYLCYFANHQLIIFIYFFWGFFQFWSICLFFHQYYVFL